MERENKVWIHYLKNILAADIPSAVFLASYLRWLRFSEEHVNGFEVINLQKFKVINQPSKVAAVLKKGKDIPFVFVAGKN